MRELRHGGAIAALHDDPLGAAVQRARLLDVDAEGEEIGLAGDGNRAERRAVGNRADQPGRPLRGAVGAVEEGAGVDVEPAYQLARQEAPGAVLPLPGDDRPFDLPALLAA